MNKRCVYCFLYSNSNVVQNYSNNKVCSGYEYVFQRLDDKLQEGNRKRRELAEEERKRFTTLLIFRDKYHKHPLYQSVCW